MNSLKELLDKVEKPGRYIGGETNIVRKGFSENLVSVVMAYPDVYEVGMSYLGLKILYHLLNEMDNVVCERVFAPWPDMERQLIAAGQRLFTLESKKDVNKFEIIGFSLSYELTYTNVLNMLHLSGITLRSADRGEEEPLVIAGGACCFNPEPMSEFIDVFFIGDSEETLPAFINEYQRIKRSSAGRKKMLRGLSRLPGVYVPSLYSAEYRGADFARLRPMDDDVPSKIDKGVIPDLDRAYYPVKQIVPLIRTVHDRVVAEIMRGCPNTCRFCQAGVINRPVRLRSPENIRNICRETYRNTGYEQIALLSLSSINYPYLTELIRGLNRDFNGKGVGISIPSLRVDEAFYELPEMMSAIRKSGLTFAPESASSAVRRSIGKDIDLRVLLRSAELAYRHGWNRLKLYFMAGFPSEAEGEAENISALARDLSGLRKKLKKRPAEIKVSVNAFVPKPHTPFQWLGMRGKEPLSRLKHDLLSRSSGKIRMEFNDINRSLLESCLSRGDRRLARVIHTAWRKGAKMDSWADFFDFSIWEDSFREHGFELEDLTTRTYSLADALPWSHIRTGLHDGHLKKELLDSGFYPVERKDPG